MKKIILSIFASFTIFSLVACSSSTNNQTTEPTTQSEAETTVEETTVEEIIVPDFSKFNAANIKTMGDFLAFKFDEGGMNTYQECITDTKFIAVEEINSTYYRAIADISKDVFDKLMGDSTPEEKEQKLKEFVYPLPVATLENLTEKIPTQEELDKWIGKTGKELFADGWDSYMYYNVQDVSAGLYHGDFMYDVVFEYNGEPMENTDDFDIFDKYKDLKIKSIHYAGIGNATNIE